MSSDPFQARLDRLVDLSVLGAIIGVGLCVMSVPVPLLLLIGAYPSDPLFVGSALVLGDTVTGLVLFMGLWVAVYRRRDATDVLRRVRVWAVVALSLMAVGSLLNAAVMPPYLGALSEYPNAMEVLLERTLVAGLCGCWAPLPIALLIGVVLVRDPDRWMR